MLFIKGLDWIGSDKIYKNTISFQFVHNLCPIFQIDKDKLCVNHNLLFIVCFFFIFRLSNTEMQQQSFVFLAGIFYLHDIFMTWTQFEILHDNMSQLMRVINDVRIINIDN